ncbi:MAG TPA: CAP domain-containing protein [Solirubrobacteraceae bacterium]|jgi:uncharacterized protein YkwD
MGLASVVLTVTMAGGPAPVSAVTGAKAARSCPGSNTSPRSDSLDKTGRAVLCLLNAERAARGLSALALDARLQIAAERHSQDMGARDFFDHVTPAGVGVTARVRAAGFPSSGGNLAEILAWGSGPFGRPAIIVKGWMTSPRHRATILNAAMRQIGIGIALDAPEPDVVAGGATYTVDFASAGSRRTRRAPRRETRRAR